MGFDFSDSRFFVGISVAALRYDTQVGFLDKRSGVSLFADAEGTLGLPENDISPVISGRYRFSSRHSLGFSFWRLRRSNTLISSDIDIGDLELAGRVDIFDRSDFYYLNYSYTLVENSHTKLFGAIGVYGLDVAYRLEASGEIRVNDSPLLADSLERSASVFAPLPMLGVDAVFALTPRWSFGAKVTVVGGSVGDVRDALVLDTSIRAQYMFSNHFGVHLGIKYFDAEFDIDKSARRTEVSYGFDGAFAGISLTF